jgi:hypothetical protein
MEKLVRGDHVSNDAGIRWRVALIQNQMLADSERGAGWAAHETMFDFLRYARDRGFHELLIDARLPTPEGEARFRRPDVRYAEAPHTWDYKLQLAPMQRDSYDASPQFEDINVTLGQRPVPLYYRLHLR